MTSQATTQVMSPHTRFTVMQRVIHWLMALCILTMLFIGVGMESTIEPKYHTLVSIHKPLGITILVLALIRLAFRMRYGAPPLPADMPPMMKLGAYLSHYAFYLLMIGMPLIGWAMLSSASYPVVLYGSLHLPPICRRATVSTHCSGIRIIIWRSRSSH